MTDSERPARRRATPATGLVLHTLRLQQIPVAQTRRLNERHSAALQGLRTLRAMRRCGSPRGLRCRYQCVARLRPYWEERIAPEVARRRCLRIASLEHTLPAPVTLVADRGDAEVRRKRIPTRVPLVFASDRATPDRWSTLS